MRPGPPERACLTGAPHCEGMSGCLPRTASCKAVRSCCRGDHCLRPAGDRPHASRAEWALPAQRAQPDRPGRPELPLVPRRRHGARGPAARRPRRVVPEPLGPLQGRRRGAGRDMAARPGPRRHGLRRQHAHHRPRRRTLATVEAGPLPYELSDELDTRGPYDFGGTLPGGFAAHTKLDPRTGELHAIAYFWAWDHVQHVVIGPAGKVTRTTDIPVADGPMMHDFALTEQLRRPLRPAGHLQHGRRLRRAGCPTPGTRRTRLVSACCPRDGSAGRGPLVRGRPLLGLPHPQRLRGRRPGRRRPLPVPQPFDVATLGRARAR